MTRHSSVMGNLSKVTMKKTVVLWMFLNRKTTWRKSTTLMKHRWRSFGGQNHLSGVELGIFSTAKSRYSVEAAGGKGSEVSQIIAIKTADSKVTQPSGH